MEKKLKVVNTFVLNNYIRIYFHHQVLKVKKNIKRGGGFEIKVRINLMKTYSICIQLKLKKKYEKYKI